jgi:hypothetical protein
VASLYQRTFASLYELSKMIRMDPNLVKPTSAEQLDAALILAHKAFMAMLEYDPTIASPLAPPGRYRELAYDAHKALLGLTLQPRDAVSWGQVDGVMLKYLEVSSSLVSATVHRVLDK